MTAHSATKTTTAEAPPYRVWKACMGTSLAFRGRRGRLGRRRSARSFGERPCHRVELDDQLGLLAGRGLVAAKLVDGANGDVVHHSEGLGPLPPGRPAPQVGDGRHA